MAERKATMFHQLRKQFKTSFLYHYNCQAI